MPKYTVIITTLPKIDSDELAAYAECMRSDLLPDAIVSVTSPVIIDGGDTPEEAKVKLDLYLENNPHGYYQDPDGPKFL